MIVRSIDGIIRMLDADYIENDDIYSNIKGVCIDSRKVVEGNLYIPICGEKHNGHTFVQQAIELGAKATLWQKNEPNPPKEITVILVDDTLKALQRLAYVYRRQLPMKVIGITGSNGKTSTKDIMASILSSRYATQKTLGNFNNEIGVPLTILSMSEVIAYGVIEMGMEQLEEIAFLTDMVAPDYAIITNIGTAHLENLQTMENIAKAKAEIIRGIQPNGCVVYFGEQELLRDAVAKELEEHPVTAYTFGEKGDFDIGLQWVKQEANKMQFQLAHEDRVFELDLLGKHQAVNALSAIFLARKIGLSDDEIQYGLHHIEKTGMRNELVQAGKCWILNDAYKSNPQSCLAAVETLCMLEPRHKVAVVADMLDLGEESAMLHFQLGKEIGKHAIDEVYTYGEMAAYIAQGVQQENASIHVQHFIDKEALITHLLPYREQEDCILLVKGSRGLHMDEVVDAFIQR